MCQTITISDRGVFTVPINIRKRLGINKAMKLELVVDNEKLIFKPLADKLQK